MGKLIATLVGLGGIYFSYCEFIREDITAMVRRTAVAIANMPHESIPGYYIPSQERCRAKPTDSERHLV